MKIVLPVKKKIINQMVKIKEFHCKINLNIQYYSKQKGIIKGVKILNINKPIYLIEFCDHNRVWAINNEFDFL